MFFNYTDNNNIKKKQKTRQKKKFSRNKSVGISVGIRWIKWKRAFETYANARKISDQKQKCSMLLHCSSMQLQDIHFTLKRDLTRYDDAKKALTQYFCFYGRGE